MRPLTDREVFMLLAAAPVDEVARGRLGTAARAGHVTPFERAQATRLVRDGSPTGAEAVDTRWGRATLARVFGLPARDHESTAPLAVALAWGDVERVLIPREQIDRTLAALASASCTTGSIADRAEALVAEVLELRARQEGR